MAYRLPGLVLAQLCTAVVGAGPLQEVARRQAQHLRMNSAIFGHGRYRSLAVIGASDHRTNLREDEDARANVLEDRLIRLLSTERYVPSSSNPRLQELVEFVYQATENTFDHARRSFDGDLIRQVRTVSIERHQIGDSPGAVQIEDVVGEADDSIRSYLHCQRGTLTSAVLSYVRAGGTPGRSSPSSGPAVMGERGEVEPERSPKNA